jgi:hypothetical protein
LFVTTYIQNSDEGTAAKSSKTTSLLLKAISSDRDFLVRKAAEEKVVIQSDIYVTNFGAKASQDYKLMLKATDIDSKLVADKQWSNTGIKIFG